MKAIRAYALLAYPVTLLLAFYVTALVDRLSLGPRPSEDDPRFILAPVHVVPIVTYHLLVVGLPTFAAGVSSLLFGAYRDKTQRKRSLSLSALSLGIFVATILVLRWDPLGVGAWCRFGSSR